MAESQKPVERRQHVSLEYRTKRRTDMLSRSVGLMVGNQHTGDILDGVTGPFTWMFKTEPLSSATAAMRMHRDDACAVSMI
jgi:hypothetical protein